MTGSTINNYNRQEVQTRPGSGRLGHLVSCHVRLGGDLMQKRAQGTKWHSDHPHPPSKGWFGQVQATVLKVGAVGALLFPFPVD